MMVLLGSVTSMLLLLLLRQLTLWGRSREVTRGRTQRRPRKLGRLSSRPGGRSRWEEYKVCLRCLAEIL